MPTDAAAARAPLAPALAEPLAPLEAEIYAALSLGLRDYVEKNGFEHVVLGLSGGIDSALVACLAVDSLGPERVSVAVMPSPYSSSATQRDARALAATLGVSLHELAIEPALRSYLEILGADLAQESDGSVTARSRAAGSRAEPATAASAASGAAGSAVVAASTLPGPRGADLTEQNLQARIRGNLLMALSNRVGWLVLTTRNKAEMSGGYTTL